MNGSFVSNPILFQAKQGGFVSQGQVGGEVGTLKESGILSPNSNQSFTGNPIPIPKVFNHPVPNIPNQL